MHSILWVTGLLIGGLLLALMELPYGYYQLLRVAVCFGCVFVILNIKGVWTDGWVWALAITAVVYNPFLKLSLGSEVWPIANVLTAALLILVGFKARSPQRQV